MYYININYNIIAWTCDKEHYTALFLCYCDKYDKPKHMLISCGVQNDYELEAPEEREVERKMISFSARAINEYIEVELNLLNLSLYEDIDFICGDNCAVNRKMAELITEEIEIRHDDPWVVPLVGCASHRLNLARQKMFEKHSVLIDKIDDIMKQLKTLKNYSVLRNATHLMPIRKNKTRWFSTNKMCERYMEIAPYLENCDFGSKSDLTNLLLTPAEKKQLTKILDVSKYYESVSLDLQYEGDKQLSMLQVRKLFDGLIDLDPEAELYLGADSHIIQDPVFEKAIVNLQLKRSLNDAEEKERVKRFKINEEIAVASQNYDDDDDQESVEANSPDEWKKSIYKAAQQMAAGPKVMYRSTAHVYPTSNIVERLFSRAKLIMTDHRKRLEPWKLELLLLLRFNKDLWDVYTIEKIVESKLHQRESQRRRNEKLNAIPPIDNSNLI